MVSHVRTQHTIVSIVSGIRRQILNIDAVLIYICWMIESVIFLPIFAALLVEISIYGEDKGPIGRLRCIDIRDIEGRAPGPFCDAQVLTKESAFLRKKYKFTRIPSIGEKVLTGHAPMTGSIRKF